MELYSDPAASKLVSGGKLHYGRQLPFQQEYVRGTSTPEHSWKFFTPATFGIKLAPDDFRRQIKEIDPRFEVVWHPVNERWTVWAHQPSLIKHPRMKGWTLVFIVQYQDGTYMPLDARTLSRAWDRCGRKYHSMAAYWAQIEDKQDSEHAKNLADRRALVRDMAGEQWDSQRIMVSGCGHSSGSKFSKHHAGG